MPTVEQWQRTWEALGATAPEGLYERLLACYSEPRRYYHTARHLDECFAAFEAVRSLAMRPAEIEIALWFHDAIYDTKRNDNEEKSADWARAALVDAGVSAEAAERVHALVLATRHEAAPQSKDAAILVDVDLSILGATPKRFAEYERQVRLEYGWVPDRLFRRTRRKILEEFLRRPSIYTSEHFRGARQRAARSNLSRSVDRLRSKLWSSDLLLLVAVVAWWAVARLVFQMPRGIAIAVAIGGAAAYWFAMERWGKRR
ncbi:MAG TPA: N-methyl-D-aspartate receptor NMDAR2C subunit [Gammaproteobacteria bacterium]|nr:N-methyl-D-aspartate receptor NMDAR2C subunit [Gammaproteobacteria bacterium]